MWEVGFKGVEDEFDIGFPHSAAVARGKYYNNRHPCRNHLGYEKYLAYFEL